MRVLVLDEELPWPPDTGKRIRTWELLRRLAPEFEIVLAHAQSAPPPPDAVAAFAAAAVARRPIPRAPLVKRGWRFAWDLARNALLRSPYMVMAHAPRSVRSGVARLLALEPFDLVHVEWTALVAALPDSLAAPLVVSAHNVEAQIWERYWATERRWPHRWYVGMQLRKVRRFERRALARADRVLAVSPGDAARIRRDTGNDRVTVVPNGVDVVSRAPRADVPVVPGSSVFVGSLDWRPNRDGVLFFLEAIWPRVLARRPEATFTVVGRGAPDGLADRIARIRGVIVAGEVPDVRPYVAQAAVSVVPLRIGGGSRLKILEALAMERPVVSTTIGAEGLGLEGGIVRADGPQGFADALVGLLADPVRAQAIARRGRAAVLAEHSWDRIARVQARVWREVVGARRDAPTRAGAGASRRRSAAPTAPGARCAPGTASSQGRSQGP